jgi:hypothetical protein
VVITIIAILAGLITVAAANAMWRMKQARIKVEVDQMDAAMKAFKQQYGAYPPCDLRVGDDSTSNPQLRAFLARAFPRYAKTNTNQLDDDLMAAGVDTANFNPARALVYWLGGLSPDVTNPFTGGGTRTPLFGFDKTRLIIAADDGAGQIGGEVANDATKPGNKVYVPQGGQNVPYVYYDYRSYTFGAATDPQPQKPTPWPASTPTMSPWLVALSPGSPTPYAHDIVTLGSIQTTPPTQDNWANPDSFQIISAGQDGKYGNSPGNNVKAYPTGINYNTEDNDNLTNFSDRAALEDAIP